MSTGLDARVVVRRSGLLLDATVHAGPGTTLAVIGPNGAGKTTLLRGLIGLARLDPSSHVRLDGVDLTGLPVERRPIGVAFQEPSLLPGRSALDNVAFGLRHRSGLGRDAARTAAGAWLERFGLASRAGARPHELSGGEAQRVALARALATDPPLLLLDEPLAALDATTRPLVRDELRRHLIATPTVCVLVTHDADDLRTLADHVVVLAAGHVRRTATLVELTDRPASGFEARLFGC